MYKCSYLVRSGSKGESWARSFCREIGVLEMLGAWFGDRAWFWYRDSGIGRRFGSKIEELKLAT